MRLFRKKNRKPTFEESLRPQLKVKRLNRVPVYILCAVAVVVMWAFYFGITRPSPMEQYTQHRPRTPDTVPDLDFEQIGWQTLQKAEAELLAAEAEEAEATARSPTACHGPASTDGKPACDGG